jgi:hypothetical protein
LVRRAFPVTPLEHARLGRDQSERRDLAFLQIPQRREAAATLVVALGEMASIFICESSASATGSYSPLAACVLLKFPLPPGTSAPSCCAGPGGTYPTSSVVFAIK